MSVFINTNMRTSNPMNMYFLYMGFVTSNMWHDSASPVIFQASSKV